MLGYQRRSSSGRSIPTWLTDYGSTVLLKKGVRSSKYDSMHDEVELIEANPDYAYIKYPDGSESTVSSRRLAPLGGNDCKIEDENSLSDGFNRIRDPVIVSDSGEDIETIKVEQMDSQEEERSNETARVEREENSIQRRSVREKNL